MRVVGWGLPLSLLLASGAHMALAKDQQVDRLAALLAQTDGASRDTAYRVSSVGEEYAILRARHLTPGMQSLVNVRGRSYDTIEVTDTTGAKTTVWFDISTFFGHEFGF